MTKRSFIGASVAGPIIDQDVLESYRVIQAAGQDVVAELIDSFLGSYRGLVERLRSAVGSDIPQHIRAAAQALKGRAGSVGAMVVWGLCARLEAGVRTGSTVEARELLGEIEAEVAKAVDALRVYRQE